MHELTHFLLHVLLAFETPKQAKVPVKSLNPTVAAPAKNPETFSSHLKNLCAATTIAMSVMADPTNAFSGKVIEGPSNSEMVEVTLAPGEQMLSEVDTLLYASDGVSFKIEYRGQTVGRILQGGRLATNAFTNDSPKEATVAFAPQFPSRILPVQLKDHGGTIISNVHSILATPYNVELDFERSSLHGPKVFNLLRQERVAGTGTIYLTGAGNIIEKQLSAGEKLKLYPGAWVAMTDNMPMDFVKGRNNIFAQSLLEVEGPGTIWIDTSPIQRTIDEIDHRLPHRS